jgi:primary-amine oxidase
MESPSTTVIQNHRSIAHPLEPLTADEIRRARAVVQQAGHVTDSVRFPLITLLEPPKAEVLAHRPGDEAPRRVLLIVLDLATGDTHEAVVSLATGELDEWVQVPTAAPPYGQAPIMLEEFELVEQIVRADPGWREAIAKRGVEDLGSVFVAPLSPGQFGHEDEAGKRILRSLSFLRDHATDSPWAHPVEGLIAHVDIIEKKVIKLVDTGVLPVPGEQGNFDEAHVGPPRTTLRPLEITQPDGPSFAVEGNEVTWQNWKLRVSLDPREGLVLHTVSFTDGARERPIIYRASIAEMVVPYGDPSPTRFWISYFDSGEYLLGKQANSLELGCDCLGEIYYFDAVLADDRGEPYTLRNAICMHEEDYGILWKHTDTTGGGIAETRRSRRLVISFFATIGNYDYGFYWYLYLDGTMQMEAKLTGIVFTAGLEPGTDWEHGVELAPGLGAPNHQHLFSARLDMMVDGVRNSVQEIDVEPLPVGEDNPYGNAWRTKATTIRSEAEGARTADVQAARTWKVINPDSLNRMGKPVGYKLVTQPTATLLNAPGSSVANRAVFATKHLWVTRYDPEQRYPAGNYPNQHSGGAGIPEWIKADRALEGEDVVLWHTFGATHVVRTEDWPVMPVEYAGFTLKPANFFDRNPALDLPRNYNARADGHGSSACH